MGGFTFLTTILLLIFSGLAAADVPVAGPQPQVVPAVQQWQARDGSTKLPVDAVLFVPAKDSDALEGIASGLKDELAESAVKDVSVRAGDQPHPGSIFLTIDKAFNAGGAHVGEAYQVEITDSVHISAATPIGIYYGTRTLLQLQRQNNGALPRGTITDYPEYFRRMLMIDAGRKPIPVWVLKDFMRMMAWFKMNELHLHLSDDSGNYSAFRIQSKQFPGLAAKDLSYSWEDLRDVQDFAKARGITITPEIDMPGHAGSITSYWPELRNPDGLLDKDKLDVTNPKTAETMKLLLGEMIPLFDAPDFHIGTDEFHIGGTPEQRQKVGEAFRQFINTMNRFVRSKGKNCRIWSGFESMPGTTLPDASVIVDMWVTRDAKSLIEQGHSVISSSDGVTYIVPGAHYYGVSNNNVYANWEPFKISRDATKNPAKDDPHLLGGKLHIWNDQGPAGYTLTEIADLALPSIQTFSEKLWGHKGSANYKEFASRAALTLPVPDISILERDPAINTDGLVFQLDGEKTLDSAAATIALPWAKNPTGSLEYSKPTLSPSRSDLEYPWTLSMKIKRTADFPDRGVILSSDLVEICANYSKVTEVTDKDADGKPIKKKNTKTGVGIARAAGMFGKDPHDSAKTSDIDGIADAPLPLNEWVDLRIIGVERRTQFYIDGKLVSTLNNQMVCPLRQLGSPTGSSFIGIVKDLKVWNRALPIAPH